MIIDIGLIGHKWIEFQSLFHCLDTFFILFEGKISNALFVKNLWISFIDIQCSVKIINSKLILFHIEVTLRTIFQEFYFVTISLNRHIEVSNSFLEVEQRVITAT